MRGKGMPRSEAGRDHGRPVGVQPPDRVVRVEGTFCIDLRMFRRVGWMKGSRVHDPNTGNVMYGNIIDGRCRFRIRRSDPTSHKGANIKL